MIRTSRSRSRTTGRPTLAEVAKHAGVSQITASRALRGVETVNPEMAARVREAAVALGYVANPAARALASSRSASVVVLIPSLSNQLFIDTLEAIHDVLRPRGLEVLIGNHHYSPDEEERLIRNYLPHQPMGMLLTGFDRTAGSRQLLEASQIPCVHMMELGEASDVPCVGFSQYAAGEAAAQHLLRRGCRRPAYIAAQLDPRVMQRGAGYRDALKAAGIHDPSLERLDPAPSSIELGGYLFRQLMAQHPDVDAIFFCNDDLAQGAAFEAQRMGLSVPGKVALVGFNDLPASAWMVPRLTSIHTPRAEVGHHAAQMLLAMLDGRASPRRMDLGFELRVRESS